MFFTFLKKLTLDHCCCMQTAVSQKI